MNVRMKSIAAKIASLCLCAVMAAGLMAGPLASVAYADEYTYQATIYAGNHGRFGNALDIRVNNKNSGSSYRIERGSGDKIIISGLKKGDVVSIDVTRSGAVTTDADSPYYVRGLRDSGMDNSEAGHGAFRVDRDRDFVVAYGMRSQETSYTVYYQTADGVTLEPAHTYYGNVGDKPVAAYLYIDGYMPLTYNLTKTLSDNPAENTMTFVYVPEKGPDVTIRVPGPVVEEHIPGGTVTVDVPGPVIVQRPAAGQNTGTQTGTNGNQGQASDNNGGQTSDGTSGGNNQTQTGGNNQAQTGGNNQAQTGSNNQAQTGGNNQAQTGGDNQGQTGGNDSSQTGGDNQDQTGGNDPSQIGGNQTQSPNGSGNPSQTGGNTGTSGGQIDLSGVGGHGSRDDGANGNAQTGDPGDGSGDNAGNEYRPGGSRDVIISSNYEPSEIVDLDENPSGVPMDDTPDGQGDATMDGQIDGQTDGQDNAQDGMNENPDGTGTGTMSPEKPGLPILPIVLGVIGVVAVVVIVVLVAYKKQQGGEDGDE